MQRRDFLKQACGAGVCGCAVAALFSTNAVYASDEPKPAAKPDAKPEGRPETKPTPPREDGRIAFAQERYAKLLEALAPRVDPVVLTGALAEVGSYCAGTSKTLNDFAGKPDEFVAFIREKWHGDAEYDKARGMVTLAFPPTGRCPCPLVKKGLTPATMCQCSVGWQKRTFGVVMGRPVEVKLRGSLLQGADRCSFEIRTT